MTKPAVKHLWTDERLDQLLGNLLRAGVVTAAAIVVAGAAVYLVRHGLQISAYHVFRGEPSDLRSVGGIVADVFSERGRGLIQLGLLVLIATPIARVVLSVAVFAVQRDGRYVVFTLIVLLVLVYSLLGGQL